MSKQTTKQLTDRRPRSTTSSQAVADWRGLTGRLEPEHITTIPDWQNRLYYISGPNAMVEAYKTMLRKAGVARRHIITDHFSGY